MPPSDSPITRQASPAVTIDRVHARMQSHLFWLLCREHGAEAVILERNCVDITVTRNRVAVFIEIKTCSTARQSIREALGQILEYAYYRANAGFDRTELVIASPAKLDDEAAAYLGRLRKEFRLPIEYVWFCPGDPLPAVLRGKSN